ncbi:small multi-drug export protein [Alicyclobacillus suci]|uniref:small multi-drug export protein n=1 Tax=Alicyclobacillus suci TaxID=2816080 RepID=UPI001F46BD9C|nr:small multi-drug export protein [Alicyclobacillus suci]
MIEDRDRICGWGDVQTLIETEVEQSTSFVRRVVYGACIGCGCFLAALLIGILEGKLLSTISLIGTSIVFEAQPAALASIPLRFHPLSGALISILANLISIPLMVLTFNEIMERWKWVKRKLQKAEKWSSKYGKYGVWILTLLSPLLGAYVSIAVGFAMRWDVRLVLTSVLIGMIGSSFLIAYGGESVAHLFGVHT